VTRSRPGDRHDSEPAARLAHEGDREPVAESEGCRRRAIERCRDGASLSVAQVAAAPRRAQLGEEAIVRRVR